MFGIKGNRMVDKILYSLEKQYSRMITIKRQLEIFTDPTTGMSAAETQDFNIKAIVLPKVNVRKHLYNSAFLSMARNFTYGSLFDKMMTPIIVKKSRIGHVQLTTDDYCIMQYRDGSHEVDYETVPNMIDLRFDFHHVGETDDGKSFHILSSQSPAVGDMES
jgi:hypothetical protein